MATQAKSLIAAFKANDESFKYFSDWLDAKHISDDLADLARELFARA